MSTVIQLVVHDPDEIRELVKHWAWKLYDCNTHPYSKEQAIEWIDKMRKYISELPDQYTIAPINPDKPV